MVTTAFISLALSGLIAPNAANTLPTWQPDYAQAMAAAVAQQKPMIVFIGRGDSSYAGVLGNNQLPQSALTTLGQSFVSLSLDTETAAGKALAGEFGINEGVVISGKGGKLQALRHAGSLSPETLTGYLTRFSNQPEMVVSTELAGMQPLTTPSAPVTSYYAPQYAPVYQGGCANGSCGSSGYRSYPSMGGCSSGRCR